MSEAKWIVKSSGRILGPMTIEEISEQLRLRQYSIFDEIREPGSRWMILREHPLLSAIVRQIRDEHASGTEATASTFVTAGKTVTSSVTERIFEETPDPSGDMIPIHGTEKTINSGGIAGNAYGALNDTRVQERLQQTKSRWMIASYAIGIFFLIGAGLVWQAHRSYQLSTEQAEEYFRLSVDLASRGDFERAYEALGRIEATRPLRIQENLLQVKILLSMDGTSAIDISRGIDRLAREGQNISVSLELLRGLEYSRLGRWREALGMYQSAARKNPQLEEAQLNQAAAAMVLNDHVRAWSLLKNPRYGRFLGYYQLLKTNVALELEDRTAWEHVLEEFSKFDVYDEKDRVSDAGRQYYFERLLLLTAVAHRAGRKNLVEEYRKKLVQVNPFESYLYMRSPFLDWQIVNWKKYLQYCERLQRSMVNDGVTQGIGALCLAASGDMVGSLNALEQAQRQFGSDQHLSGVHALLLLQSGRKNEAERTVQASPSDRLLTSWVRGVLCEERLDNTCAERAWENVRSYDAGEPRAYFGLARAAKDLGNDSQYLSTTSMGLRLAPGYRPLLQLTGGRYEF